MKKIVLTETQAEKLMDKVVSEQIAPSDRYTQEVKCGFGYHNLTYQGNEIDWIEDVKFSVSFDIHVDARSYGIKDINIMSVRGPEAIEIVVIYYPEGAEDHVEADAVVRLNWDDVKIDNDADIGWIGIDHDIDIELEVDQEGNFTASMITVHSKEI